jgi:hypothetical protein
VTVSAPEVDAITRGVEMLADEIGTGQVDLWTLSFTDPKRSKGSQWVGTIMVEAFGLVDALTRVNALGLNPGGAVMGMGVPLERPLPHAYRERWCGRLMTDRREVEDMPMPWSEAGA